MCVNWWMWLVLKWLKLSIRLEKCYINTGLFQYNYIWSRLQNKFWVLLTLKHLPEHTVHHLRWSPCLWLHSCQRFLWNTNHWRTMFRKGKQRSQRLTEALVSDPSIVLTGFQKPWTFNWKCPEEYMALWSLRWDLHDPGDFLGSLSSTTAPDACVDVEDWINRISTWMM